MISARFDTESLTQGALRDLADVRGDRAASRRCNDPAGAGAAPAVDRAGAARDRAASTWRRCCALQDAPTSTTRTSSTRRRAARSSSSRTSSQTMLATPADADPRRKSGYAYRGRAAAGGAGAVRRASRAQAIERARGADARLLGALPRRALAADALAARARRALPRRARSPTAARARLFCDLDDRRQLAATACCSVERSCDDATLDLDERGLLLMPSVFVWPKVTRV